MPSVRLVFEKTHLLGDEALSLRHNSVMTEFELIKACFTDWPVRNPNIQTTIGDDGLVWQHEEPLVISTDTAVEGVHFPVGASPERIAQRAFLPALSDLAAMAASPEFFTLSLTLPKRCQSDWVLRFAKRLQSLSQRYGLALAGGDTTSGDLLVITIGVHGTCRSPVLRSGAQQGDDIWVTGWLGRAAAALPTVLMSGENHAPEGWVEAYWAPQPRIQFALLAASSMNCAIDISDGLSGDAGHIARASGVQMNIHIDQLPLDNAVKALGEKGLNYALAGGDDYELLLTASPENRDRIESAGRLTNTPITRIGAVGNGDSLGVSWFEKGLLREFDGQSFTHF